MEFFRRNSSSSWSPTTTTTMGPILTETVATIFHGWQVNNNNNNNFNATGECRLVTQLNDIDLQCKFARQVDDCFDDSLIDYIRLAYCTLESQVGATMLFLLMLAFLFLAIGTTADDFLCPTLVSISKSLKLSDNIAGVTFLAIGNGAPDIFSSIIGIANSDPNMVIGQLYGGGIFVTTIVVGSILIRERFQIMNRPLLRDISFYLITTTLVWITFYRGKIELLHALCFIAIYLVYVVVVVASGVIYRKNRVIQAQQIENGGISIFDKKNAAMPRDALKRATKYRVGDAESGKNHSKSIKTKSINPQVTSHSDRIENNNCSGSSKISLKNLYFRQNSDNYEGVVLRRIKFRRYCTDGGGGSGGGGSTKSNRARMAAKTLVTTILEAPKGQGAAATANQDAKQSVRFSDKFAEDANNNDNGVASREHHIASRRVSMSTKPELDGRDERNYRTDHDHTINAMQTDSAIVSNSLSDRRYTISDCNFPAVQARSATPQSQSSLLSFGDRDGGRGIFSLTNLAQFCRQLIQRRREKEREKQATSPKIDKPNLPSKTIINDLSNCSIEPSILAIAYPPNNANLKPPSHPHNHLSQNQAYDNWAFTASESNINEKSLHFSQIHHPASGTEQSKMDSLIRVCAQFAHYDREQFSQSSTLGKLSTILKAPIYALFTLTIPVVDLEQPLNGWRRALNLLQLLISPQCCLCITRMTIWSLETYQSHLALLAISLILIAVVTCTSESDRAPKYHIIFAYFGFLIAIAWVYTIAKEVVALLKSIGVIFNLSQFMLGLTFLAWGNSIGDFISNLTMAGNGFPRMAISACFGGPVLNMLLGIGVPYAFLLVKQHETINAIHLDYNRMISVMYGTIMASLCTTIVVLVAITKFKSTRAHGFALYALYALFIVSTIFIELNHSTT